MDGNTFMYNLVVQVHIWLKIAVKWKKNCILKCIFFLLNAKFIDSRKPFKRNLPFKMLTLQNVRVQQHDPWNAKVSNTYFSITIHT